MGEDNLRHKEVEKLRKNEYYCMALMDIEKISAAVKIPQSDKQMIEDLKRILSYVDKEPEWDNKHNIWIIPLTIFSLYNSDDSKKREDVKSFFDKFTFSDGAKSFLNRSINP